ncbi:hypothetical protein J7384_17840 [Endozoicomonas sp. G2_1]|uniref:hypothetical protein n=1 Tax=Endozoicomonas sp. G2_1 TaxID=2821091 RepID=UPI001ADAA0D1|nr:hypothetical protein [Endozoicomonas sp. G2_1]MBO9492228.1 hypothetical protein [Endozoicomonas sp. G2_1]
MRCLDELLPLLKLEANGVPDFIARNILRLSLQEFCQESDYWRVEVRLSELGDQLYRYSLPAGLIVCRLVQVQTEDGEIVLKANVDYEEPERGQLLLLNNITDSKPLKVFASVKPDSDGDDVSESLFENYREAIVSGALVRLLRQPDKSWSNPNMVPYHENKFSEGYRAARRERLNKNARHSKKTVKHRFY